MVQTPGIENELGFSLGLIFLLEIVYINHPQSIKMGYSQHEYVMHDLLRIDEELKGTISIKKTVSAIPARLKCETRLEYKKIFEVY